jgi:predicted transcriptional regulator of viral defense system/very-short-patch-repair endonuclease
MSASPTRLDPDRRVAELASRQHGIVTTRQLRDVGVSARMIARRTRTGGLVRLHRGVYRVGPVEAPRAREMAAVLAVGAGACLSHRSAACLWGLLPRRATGEEPQVLVTRLGVRQPTRGGFRVHYTRSLPDRDRTERFGIPVTTPERTLLDLAAQAGGVGSETTNRRAVTRRDLERAVAAAERKRRVELDTLRARIESRPHRAGMKLLRGILELDGGPAFTRSAAEENLLELIRSAGLPAPDVNTRVGRFELDLFWRRERVALEVDGYLFHRGRGRFEGDRARDSDLAARGILVVRFTARRIRDHPLKVVAELAQVLGRRTSGRSTG